jgi:hypothetical protein
MLYILLLLKTYFKLSLHSSEDIITIEISAGGSNTDSGAKIRVFFYRK